MATKKAPRRKAKKVTKKAVKKRPPKSEYSHMRRSELEERLGRLGKQVVEEMQRNLDQAQAKMESDRKIDAIYEVLHKTQAENIILVASLNERKKAFDDHVARQFKASNIRAGHDPLYRLMRDAWREHGSKIPLDLFGRIAAKDVARAHEIEDELMLGNRSPRQWRDAEEPLAE